MTADHWATAELRRTVKVLTASDTVEELLRVGVTLFRQSQEYRQDALGAPMSEELRHAWVRVAERYLNGLKEPL